MVAQVCAEYTYDVVRKHAPWLSMRQYKAASKQSVMQKHAMGVVEKSKKV